MNDGSNPPLGRTALSKCRQQRTGEPYPLPPWSKKALPSLADKLHRQRCQIASRKKAIQQWKHGEKAFKPLKPGTFKKGPPDPPDAAENDGIYCLLEA